MKRITFILVFSLGIVYFNCGKSSEISKYEIAYSAQAPGDLYYMDITGQHKLKVTDYNDHDGSPSCSPDGKRIAFYAYYDEGKTWSIHIMNIDGSDRKRLTFEKYAKDWAPKWSPDGNSIMFARSNNDSLQIWMMDSEGNNLSQLKNITGTAPNFITNERIIYNSHWDDTADIYISNLDGSNVVRLTDNSSNDSKPMLSPDGKKIAFMTNRDGNEEIYLMDLDGTNQIRITENTYADSGPNWSPDGEKILFLSDRDGDYEIYLMNKDGSSLEQLTNNDFRDIQPTWLYPIK